MARLDTPRTLRDRLYKTFRTRAPATATRPSGAPRHLDVCFRTPTVFVNSINGADGLILDEHDNLWVAANQADEIVVVDPTVSRDREAGRLRRDRPKEEAERTPVPRQPRAPRRGHLRHEPRYRPQDFRRPRHADAYERHGRLAVGGGGEGPHGLEDSRPHPAGPGSVNGRRDGRLDVGAEGEQ